ncbi:MAG: hypothetical protein AAF653_11995 [Chloroflexota bacterium]
MGQDSIAAFWKKCYIEVASEETKLREAVASGALQFNNSVRFIVG